MGSKRSGRAANSYILVLLCVWNWIGSSEAASLDPNQANALQAIAKELGKTDWNFSASVDPCSDDRSWNSPSNNQQNPTYANQLDCTCSGGVCHVVNISLKGQDLAGVLPKSLAKLPYLEHIDLSRNYLTGSIPQEWTSMAALEYVSVIVNRLSGPIPTYLGNMTTLTYLSIEDNMFSGPVPAELGKLVKLQSLTLNGNYLTGQLPNALTNLSNLTELRISSNNFSGKIPDYFQSWTELQMLEIQGSGFSGPIPSSISNLTDLSEMDLSFNNLVGPIPDELQNLKINYMYLTNNFLTGFISNWIKNIGIDTEIDLFYNNFNECSLPSTCNKENLNLYRSSSRELNSSLALCLEQNFPCSSTGYSFHINCGGNEIKIGKTSYEGDNDGGSPAKFNPNKA